MKLFHYLVLIRPANVVTAISDILAGVAIAGFFLADFNQMNLFSVLYLVLATMCLYSGGIVFNDVFDLALDKVERPERVIPSGKISKTEAVSFGLFLFALGLAAAAQIGIYSLGIAAAIILMSLVYDKWAKHSSFFGPLTMGTCRGLNLLLGMSILNSSILPPYWFIAFIPIVFIAAITLTSQGEVHAGNSRNIKLALLLDMGIAATILYLSIFKLANFWLVLPFVAVWFGMNFMAKRKAILVNEPANIKNAVKTGVISLIPLNASYAAGFSDWPIALGVLLLFPISLFLAKKFAVT